LDFSNKDIIYYLTSIKKEDSLYYIFKRKKQI
jgi:hypothetical protein